MSLQKKLEAAEGEVLLAEAAHREAALASAEGDNTAATAKLSKAAKALQEARWAVVDLTAAIDASNQREAERIASEAAETARILAGALSERRATLRQQGVAWDVALQGLVDATESLVEAGKSVDALGNGTQSLDRAQMMALDIVKWRLRFWTGAQTVNIPSDKITTHII